MSGIPIQELRTIPEVDPAKLEVLPGRPYPAGPMVHQEGVRFTLFSRHATQVWLCLFASIEDKEPFWECAFDPKRHRTGDMWSIFVRGLTEGVYYMYRVDGPNEPKKGHRFDASKYLFDPYATAFSGDVHDGNMKCVVVHERMNWPADHRPRIPLKDAVIYETHVRGFTKHESSGVTHGGTYAGLVEKIPYLKDLGVTTVELLPINEFGETYLGRKSLETGEELTNYWGYSSIGFFAPAGRYASSAVNREHLEEFRAMVHALHDAGMEVILDVVFNHTSEGNEQGPTLSFRGIDNSIYYLLEGEYYKNYSGCGNTVNCNHPLVRDFILDCLRYWVVIMHVDGFRFDLASILGRDENGNVLEEAPLIKRIAQDPVLRDVKLIAEAWDAGGAYQVGSFGGARWAEWNGRYRDDVRQFWTGQPGTRAAFASRVTGSEDIYAWSDRNPEHSINFITCHDGFTLRDLVSYREKRNWANGEQNRDGSNHDMSFNCGAEGEVSGAPEVYELRMRMQKNFLGTLFLSLGVPMMLGGDEFGRTQSGNNNAYCQDNEISWFNWALLEDHAQLHRFTKAIIAFRKENPALRRTKYFTGQSADQFGERRDIIWYEPDGNTVNWDNHKSGFLGWRIDAAVNNGISLFIAVNNSKKATDFTLPREPWRLRVNTFARSPEDIFTKDHAPRLAEHKISVGPRSLIVLSG